MNICVIMHRALMLGSAERQRWQLFLTNMKNTPTSNLLVNIIIITIIIITIPGRDSESLEALKSL